MVAAALAAAGVPALSHAAAFALYEQGASGLGTSYAGAAAVAEDASTVWWNPAGMAWLGTGRHFAIAGTYVRPSTTFTDNGSVAAAGRPLGGTGGDPAQSAFVPSGFFVMPVTPRVSFGLAVGIPFGLKTEYEPTWLGRFQGISSDLQTVNFNPSLSYRFNEFASVGGGISYMMGQLDLLSAVNLGAAEAQNSTSLDGDGWGYNVGAQVKSGGARVGFHYRSPVKINLDGQTSFAAPAPSSLNGRVSMDVQTPASFAFSLAQRVSPQLELLADATWWRWGEISQLPIVRTDGPSNGATLDTLVLDFRNTWRFSAGANYKLSGPWTLKLGVAYDQTPVKHAETRTVRLPDSDRYWLSAGVKWDISKGNVLDFGYAYLKAKDAEIENNQTATNRGIVRGTYESTIHLFGVQYQHTF
jgi:long-chain fatty acid transport protein